MALVNPTLNQRRAELTEKVKAARQEFLNIERMLKHDVRKAHPDMDWWEQMSLVETDSRYQVANARLLALCDAANIMGAELF